MDLLPNERRCCWSISVLACLRTCKRTHTQRESIVYVFLLSSLKFDKCAYLTYAPRTFGCVRFVVTTARWWLCNSCATPLTFAHIVRSSRLLLLFFSHFTRGTVPFFCTYVLNALQIVASKHICSLTCTQSHSQVRTHVNRISCCESFACWLAYLFVILLTQPVRQSNVLFRSVVLLFVWQYNRCVRCIHVAMYKPYRCRDTQRAQSWFVRA